MSAATPPARTPSWPALLGLGFFTDFLDTLGVGSFATTTAALKLGRMVEDEDLPGTLNVGHALPTLLEAALYIAVIEVQAATLLSMITAGILGAWFGARLVSRWPRRRIQVAMSVALLLTATFITLRQLKVFPPGGEALGLTGVSLLAALLANAFISSLTALGIGNYAPCLALVSLLGMNPKAAFPIMMGSAALILPVAALQFHASRRYHRRIALGLTLGGIPGVLVAAFLVKELPLDAVRWMVVGVLVLTSAMMLRSARAAAASGEAVRA